MAFGVAAQHHLFSIHANYNHSPIHGISPYRCSTKCANGYSSVRFRTITKSSANKTPRTIPEKPKPPIEGDRVDDLDNGRNSFSSVMHRIRAGIKLDGLGMEILSIALPAALALAADPITSLVDTGFVGHIGSAELAAVGVSGAVFNLVSKLFNVPLLNVTTSFVAEEQASALKDADDGSPTAKEQENKIFLPSVSNAIILAAGLGIIEAVALFAGSSFLMDTMGIPVDSPMRAPAEQFLALRAFGAPPIVVALAAQGTFRGFKDTKTPLYAVGKSGNLLNALLDLILIFYFGFGISGAAIATVTSEYLTALILLWKLSDKLLLVTPSISGQRVAQYLKSGALLTARTIAVLSITTLATSMAAREGPIQMAGFQICFEVWLALSLLNDALALAGQALLASDYSQGNYSLARQLTYKVLQIGLVMGVGLAVILYLGFGALSSLFSTDSAVLEIARSGTLFVAASQPFNAIAFVFDGLYYGVSDFGFAAYSMIVVALISAALILVAAPSYGIAGVWGGLFIFMALRVAAGFTRISTRTGPWRLLMSDTEKDGA
ncbi:hypothetical protein SASPL_111928 [Salvia splendens]|uniref:Protein DETOXIFICATION n=1 Tax=Salvia splendens TaxID=180675 RepID=A0A8X9A2U0_SALSN|nr:hypothetical protein SASPL_111928 [Salvia splendens]